MHGLSSRTLNSNAQGGGKGGCGKVGVGEEKKKKHLVPWRLRNDTHAVALTTTITGNQAGRSGGGAYFSDTAVDLRDCQVVSNVAGESGGGIAGDCNPFVGYQDDFVVRCEE